MKKIIAVLAAVLGLVLLLSAPAGAATGRRVIHHAGSYVAQPNSSTKWQVDHDTSESRSSAACDTISNYGDQITRCVDLEIQNVYAPGSYLRTSDDYFDVHAWVSCKTWNGDVYEIYPCGGVAWNIHDVVDGTNGKSFQFSCGNKYRSGDDYHSFGGGVACIGKEGWDYQYDSLGLDSSDKQLDGSSVGGDSTACWDPSYDALYYLHIYYHGVEWDPSVIQSGHYNVCDTSG